jgi:DNA-binding MarR family transcriptional regulator
MTTLPLNTPSASLPAASGGGPASPQDGDLWSLLDGTWFAVSRMRELELARFGLTIEQSALLKMIEGNGGSASTGVLEYLTMRQPHSVSTLVARVAKMGLLEKKRAEAERRFTVVLTAQGRALLSGVTESSIEAAFSGMAGRKARQLARLLDILQRKALSLIRVPIMQYIVRDDMKSVPPRTSVASPESVWSTLDRTRFGIARLLELELAQRGITIEQSAVLRHLRYSGESVTRRDLEEKTLRQHHSISALVNRMLRSGLLAQCTSEGGRSQAVRISTKGLELVNSLTDISIEMTFSSLKSDDKRRLQVLLQRLNETARLQLATLERDAQRLYGSRRETPDMLV